MCMNLKKGGRVSGSWRQKSGWSFAFTLLTAALAGCTAFSPDQARPGGHARAFNDVYRGEYLSRVAFPMGGIGAGMICLEGTGALSHISLRHRPEIFNEQCMFAAICVKGQTNVARVLEGPVPSWKAFGLPGAGNGLGDRAYGLPRFDQACFRTRFPFGIIQLADDKVPLAVEITGWSPFTPGEPDDSSYPVAAIEYRFTNPTPQAIEAVYSFNAKNFMKTRNEGATVRVTDGGFIFAQAGTDESPWDEGAFCARVTEPDAKVNGAWFRGGWWDPLTLAWKDIESGAAFDRPAVTEGDPAPGATLFVPFTLPPGGQKTITLQMSWYTPCSMMRIGKDPETSAAPDATAEGVCNTRYRPWYTSKFENLTEVADFWRDQYANLRERSERFSNCFYDTTLPPEVVEAVAANLTIIKSPTVLRQYDGRLWCFEGCSDGGGCCHGSCTHVWNYAQAIPHLFPSLERTLRETEFFVSQDDRGHQAFRTSLPIRPTVHDFHAASDGQLGGIMKVYREWRIGGNTDWLRKMWPRVRASLDYCQETWDPDRKGVLEEPHHNTYDIEFWGPDGMCTSFYLGALTAAIQMGKALGNDVARYEDLLAKGTRYVNEQLFDGEYYYQQIKWEGLKAENPLANVGFHKRSYSPEAVELLKQEGPKYQYGRGCLADGVLGAWMAEVCGVGDIMDPAKVASHLKAVHKYNLKHDLSEHVNPQRPSYALGREGGLLLCTWPKGGQLSLPFVYSNEVWTGIEYQVAAHLMMKGLVKEGLEIVQVCRRRYDGRVRNPFNEYECGHWYARAMSSYAMLQGLSGARYDAVEKVLYLTPRIRGDFRAFLATATGYGTVGVKNSKPFLDVQSGRIDYLDIRYTPAK